MISTDTKSREAYMPQTVSETSHCFFQPSTHRCIDAAVMRPGHETFTTWIGAQTIEKVQDRYPGAVLLTWEEAQAKQEAVYKTPVRETDEASFILMLEILPPVDWRSCDRGESFKMLERKAGHITEIFARRGDRYFNFADVDTLTHAEIMGRIDEATS